ncbi:MAG: hypothetical protein HYY30_03945 [Chloroflexi bacterium]|nr:hypothetical protein [Chloroflexota bacterium]
MSIRHVRRSLIFLAITSVALAVLMGCTQEVSTPTATPKSEATTEAPKTGSSPTAKPASEAPKPAATPAAAAKPAIAPAPAARPPEAVLKIVPVPANAADAHAIKAPLPGTTSTVAMGVTGLSNVPVGVPVTLSGAAAEPNDTVKSYAWTLSQPSKSKAVLDKKDAQEVSFIPDVPGVYKIDLVVGNDAGKSAMQSMKVQAATYVGVDDGNCKTCHGDKVAEWSETNHSIIFKREIDGGADPATSHYGEGCVRCHTTGYYIGTPNGGFADVQAQTGWKFPALTSIQSGEGNWAAVPDQLKAMSNIQCESCHGPASAHVESKAPMATSLGEGVCNQCHDGGGHHIKGTEFRSAKHSLTDSQAWTYPTGPSRQACVRCHSGEGYISFLNNPTEPASWSNGKQTATCSVCHDPHSDANKFQLRIVGKPVEVASVDKDFGLSATCAECHNGRTTAADAAKGSYPHYSTAAELLSNVGGVDYGQKIVDSPHGMLIGMSPVKNPDPAAETPLFGGVAPGPCVTCHMWPTIADAKDPNRMKVGEHSFNMVSPDGKTQYTASCQSCHSGIDDFNLLAKADYDGNGKVEGVQTEVAGLLKVLQQAIADSGIKPVQGHPYFEQDALNKANDKQKNAIYNYRFVRGLENSDGSGAAIHNFKRSVMLLQLSYKDLAGREVPNAAIMK